MNLFAYTFCKITLCGLHPTRPRPPFALPPAVPQHAARFGPPSRAGRQTTLQVSTPRSLMYAELYGRNSKFGMAVLGAFTMSFHPLVLSFTASRASAEGTRLPTRLGPYKRRTRVILIRTRPRGAEVKASSNPLSSLLENQDVHRVTSLSCQPTSVSLLTVLQFRLRA